ncbi:MAG: ACT domain-containing protein [Ferrimonas sp.]
MSQYLAITAMGTDRPGLVYALAQLIGQCECDIIDSRVAIFGNEFTIIMLVSGAYSDIARLESEFPLKAAQLELMTICKRTSEHLQQSFSSHLIATFEGQDKRGTMQHLTQFMVDHGLNIRGFSSHVDKAQNRGCIQRIELRVTMGADINLDELQQSLTTYAQQFGLHSHIVWMSQNHKDNA